jgi:UDP-glucose 4-epimerase
MATLVTGGTGFVGANIVKELAGAGHQVFSLDLNAPDELTRSFLGDRSSQVTFITGDILDRTFLERNFLERTQAIDKIVHAAVYTVNRIPLEIERSREIVDINITGTTNLLELARGLRVQRFVYVSSGAAYGAAGAPDQTLNEDAAPRPDFLYGITKYTSELLTRRYGELHQLSTASVRLSTPYGPMERITGHRGVMSVLYQWTGEALRGETISLTDPDAGRDYTYVVDIADGVRTVLDAATLPHDLFNLTAGRWITYSEILERLKEILPETKVEVALGGGAAPRSSEPTRGPLSGHRLYQDLGWTPQYDLVAGLSDYLAWRRSAPFLD